MNKDPQVEKEIKRIGIGIGVFGILDLVILCIVDGVKVLSALFVLGGCLAAFFGFVWLCNSVQKTIEKAQEVGSAKGLMTKSYIGRMALYAGWVVISVLFAPTSVAKICGAIPVLFPSFIIKLLNLFNKSKE